MSAAAVLCCRVAAKELVGDVLLSSLDRTRCIVECKQ